MSLSRSLMCCKVCSAEIPTGFTYCAACVIHSDRARARACQLARPKALKNLANRLHYARKREARYASRGEPSDAALDQRCALALIKDRRNSRDPLVRMWMEMMAIHTECEGPYPQVPLDFLMQLDVANRTVKKPVDL